MFTGSMVALVTPMQPNGTVDKKALQQLVEWHIDAKTDALVVVGTTGEAAQLTTEEKDDVILSVVKQVAGRIPVIAGTGTPSTQTSLQHTQNAEKAGVDACLVITPYYVKPTQNGLYQHYKTIAENTGIPLILYNVPGRTGCDLLPETVERLAALSSIVGIKEATGNLQRASDIQQRCGTDFALYSGDDESNLALLLQGARGVISVTANIAPRVMHDFCEAALSGNKILAEKLHNLLMPLHKKLFLETNPIPTKWALHTMGLIPAGIRLPLLPLDSKYHEELNAALHLAGVTQSLQETQVN